MSPRRGRSRCGNHIGSGDFWRLVLDLAMFGDHERKYNGDGHIRNCGANLEHEWHHPHERNAGD